MDVTWCEIGKRPFASTVFPFLLESKGSCMKNSASKYEKGNHVIQNWVE